MGRLFLAMTMSIISFAPAMAGPVQTYKITAENEDGILSGVPCVLKAAGVTTKIVTPAAVDLSTDRKGLAVLDSLTCKLKGRTLATTTFVDPRTVKVNFDFGPPGGFVGPVHFLKSNGGLSAFLRDDGKVVKVR